MNTLDTKVDLVLDCKNEIGESCFWDPRDNQLWWTDIEGKKIWCIDENKNSKKFNLPDRACFILPRKELGFIIGFPNHISIANQNLTSYTKLHDIEIDIPQTRINDAKVDPFGGIVFGTFDENSDRSKRKPLGSVYRLAPNGLLTELFSKVTVSNGITFSPSGEIMYFADSPTDTIRQFQIQQNFDYFKELNLFVDKGSAPGFPDGGTVDSEGNYWSARVRGGCVVCYNSKGKLISKFNTPTQAPTCVTLGGSNLKKLFITSLGAPLHLEKNTNDFHAGNLFSLEVQISGIKQTLSIL